MIVWLHNLSESYKLLPEYKIRCWKCDKVQDLAKEWDHQHCTGCYAMLYDYR